ncbi:MAG: hypothetical protein JW801_05710 [Bacteroidales bacterium]|nr:hypothetical protein [Bacteroidales bacterium]
MAFFKDKKTRTLIKIMSVLALAGILIAYLYYKSLNDSVDPRVVPAREMYAGYNKLVEKSDYKEIFKLLDSIESIYLRWHHYARSYEVGVILNNRAAAYLNMAMLKDSVRYTDDNYLHLPKDSLLNLAETEITGSIAIYEDWLKEYAGKSEGEIENRIGNDFSVGLGSYSEKKKERFKKNRVEEMVDAQVEVPRRLSVSYTNLGLIFRNRDMYEDAAHCYIKAINYWDENLDAQNNLNVLLNEDKVKRNFLQKILPPEKGV